MTNPHDPSGRSGWAAPPWADPQWGRQQAPDWTGQQGAAPGWGAPPWSSGAPHGVQPAPPWQTGAPFGGPQPRGVPATHGYVPAQGFEPVRRRPRPLPWVLAGSGVLLVVAGVLVTGFAVPGWFVRTEFDARAVEQGVATTLQDSYDIDGVARVTCPDGQQVVPAHRFDCRIASASGPGVVTVTVKDEHGVYEVGRPK
ncbi:DUF4333 domain-containing protein [Saccharopolyspora sp. HNM0983]|uniref:DUF4333 domain-containing protein n=1 Tax=Saccharopolyspora montiporae TaxID=2781240 RepID=A0A929FZ33_9PSEU|nr:DUF4333 domain-containing protein [Saccharopolyspora sp. HNM0983]MBE9376461.1 DUF4333 domain-containing protein [Saccharopolyspora sp. HNM0983]